MKKRTICFLLDDRTKAVHGNSIVGQQNELIESIQCLNQYNTFLIEDHKHLVPTLQAGHIDLLFNMCERGYMGNPRLDPHIIALCDIYDVPYLGKNLRCHHYTNDKNSVSRIAQTLGISVPHEVYLQKEEILEEAHYTFPSILKPAHLFGSLHITESSVVRDKGELVNQYKALRSSTNEPFLVQEFIPGQEISVGLIGNDGNFLNLPLLEIDYSKLPDNLPKILPESAKKRSVSCVYAKAIGYKKAKLVSDIETRIFELSSRLFERLYFKDYARFDWRLDAQGEPFLIEANANPGVNPWGYLTFIFEFAGMSHVELLNTIIQTGLERVSKPIRVAA